MGSLWLAGDDLYGLSSQQAFCAAGDQAISRGHRSANFDDIGQSGHRSGLEQEHLSTLNRPLDILRHATEMGLDSPRQIGDLERLDGRYRRLDRTPTVGGAVAYNPFITHGFARDDALAQTACGGDHDFVAPTGERIGMIRLPETCANVCFGGAKRNRLFMAASQSLYAVYVETTGAHIA